jgi:hypothetical protein
VLDPLSRADQPGGLARGRTQRRVLLETLYNIAEERGAIASEAVQRDGKEITMCWLVDEHPLVRYARQQSAGIVHLFNFVGTTKGHGDRVDWVNQALFAELLSRVEGDALESSLRGAAERGLIRAEGHGNKPGYAIDREHPEVRMLLGEFSRLNGDTTHALPARTQTALEGEAEGDGVAALSIASGNGAVVPLAPGQSPAAPPRKRTRRGSRGGRNRRGGRGRTKTPSSGTSGMSGEAAD